MNKEEEDVLPCEVYEALGADEESVLQCVSEMEWKEGTFARLLNRELPDPDA